MDRNRCGRARRCAGVRLKYRPKHMGFVPDFEIWVAANGAAGWGGICDGMGFRWEMDRWTKMQIHVKVSVWNLKKKSYLVYPYFYSLVEWISVHVLWNGESPGTAWPFLCTVNWTGLRRRVTVKREAANHQNQSTPHFPGARCMTCTEVCVQCTEKAGQTC